MRSMHFHFDPAFLAWRIAVLVIALLWSAGAPHAQPANDVVDVGPAAVALIDWLAPVLVTVFVLVGGWLIVKVASLLGLKISAMQRAVIDHGLDRAIGYAIAKFGERAKGGIPVQMKNEAIAVAAEYAVRAVPGALKHFGKGRDDLADMIESRLEGLLVDPDAPSPTVRASAGPLGP